MKLVGRTAASRRTKAYLIELLVNDIDISLGEDGEVEIFDTEAILCYPTLAHGPEDALRTAAFLPTERVESIRRVRSPGLLRSLVEPDEEWFDLHKGEIEDRIEQELDDDE